MFSPSFSLLRPGTIINKMESLAADGAGPVLPFRNGEGRPQRVTRLTCAVDELRTAAISCLIKPWREAVFPRVEDSSGATALNLC